MTTGPACCTRPGYRSPSGWRRYVEEFDTVELNASFYRWPKDATFAGWRQRLPDGFTMSVKAHRGLTHYRRLRSPEPWVERFERCWNALGDRSEALLVQSHPDLERDDGRLQHFLDVMPDGISVAMELRHRSWDDDDRLRHSRAPQCRVRGDERCRAALRSTRHERPGVRPPARPRSGLDVRGVLSGRRAAAMGGPGRSAGSGRDAASCLLQQRPRRPRRPECANAQGDGRVRRLNFRCSDCRETPRIWPISLHVSLTVRAARTASSYRARASARSSRTSGASRCTPMISSRARWRRGLDLGVVRPPGLLRCQGAVLSGAVNLCRRFEKACITPPTPQREYADST